MNVSNHRSDFINVNEIRLHYLDWGGNGPTLIFLTGMGCSAYIFNKFAPRFTDQFRVLALTRRGQGDSDAPDTGYDADTLTEDLYQFMDHLNVEKAILAGHSLAGVELTHFAATYPTRVEKLIYLDALDDRRAEAAIIEQNPLRKIKIEKEESSPHTVEEYISDMKKNSPRLAEIWSELWDEEITHTVKVNEAGIVVDKMPESVEKMIIENLIKGHAPKKVEATIPTLSIYAQKIPRLSNAYTEEQKATFDQFHRNVEQPFFRSIISEFQERFPHAKVIVIPDGHHYCFIAQEELVYDEMRKFLVP
ncbi:MAG TPA: alpha/beta hydrolase [Anaerolineales bacterium]|jgi:pimeloyl-ACP methyl ester carboxylesterase|nr:alpha/beta hydrolase [Anaerolineales bacterium]